jgi:hypothetical protein
VYLDFASLNTNATTPNLKNIESVVVRAQSAATDANGVSTDATDGNNMPQTRTVQIDAQRSLATNDANKVIADIGVTNWESSNSRSDVVIEDVRIGNTQKTKDVTITFRESDPGNVDFGLYFDQHSLRNTGSGSTAINILLMDTAAANSTTPAIAATPLLDVNFNSYTFFQDNVKVFLGGAGTAAGQKINDALTYADMKAAFELALKTANVGGVVKDLSTSVTVSLSASVNMTTEANKSAVSASVAASFLNLTGQVITLTSAGTSTITSRSSSGESGGWESLGLAPSTGAIVQTFNTGNTSTTELVTSKIVLDDVGRGSTGGDLVVGGLSIGDSSTSRGVERFEITVEDSSKLQTINGTNNALREVTVVNSATSNFTTAYNTVSANAGDLTVNGNAGVADANLPGVNNNTTWNALGVGQNPAQASVPHSGLNAAGFTDVRLIDGSAMTGKLNFTANISVDSIGKYVNSVDTAPSPTDDAAGAGNINFNTRGANFLYTGGTNGDTMVVNIDGGVAASRSSIVPGLSDFTFNVSGGAGDDAITLNIVDGSSGVGQAWYANQKLNANVTINGGDGADTIRTPRAGDKIIDAGAGNDVIYTDNSGRQLLTSDVTAGNSDGVGGVADDADVVNDRAFATWVFNTADQATAGAAARNKADLLSSANSSYEMYKATATVTFKGITSSAIVINSANFRSTDLDINQAIKAAINNNSVLNKLIVATDGPANTLVVTSLIDGSQVVGALSVAVAAPSLSTITAADVNVYNTAYGTSLLNEAALKTAIDAGVTAFGTAAEYAANFANNQASTTSDAGALQIAAATDLVGANSTAETDNRIIGGADNDLIVLSTSANAGETIVFSGTFGTDTIVNFGANDQLNFKAYLTNLNTSTLLPTDTVTTAVIPAGTAKTSIGQNSIAVINYADLAGAADTGTFTGVTYANVTAANVLAVLNATGAGAATFSANTDATVEKIVFILVENTASAATSDNAKVFTADSVASSANFANVALVGVLNTSGVDINVSAVYS